MATSATAWRVTGVAGLATIALQLASQAFLQVGGSEPPFDAPARDVVDFFVSRDPTAFRVGSYLSVLSVLSFLWFVGGLYAVLRPDWRAPVVLACGLGYAAGIGVSGWELAAFHNADPLDPALARLAFDIGNLSFATAWVLLGGAAVAAGWALLERTDLPGWLGWWAIATGVGLVAARAVWTTPFWLVAYGSFWLWAITLCVLLLRRAAAHHEDTRSPVAVSRTGGMP